MSAILRLFILSLSLLISEADHQNLEESFSDRDWLTRFKAGGPPPNIVFILADDVGHADVGFTEGNHQTPTPNIDALAWDGIILNRFYTNPICTPTRSALLTGKYTFHTGMQSGVITPGTAWGLPLNFKLLPEYLKELNYSTTILGKWHLGSKNRSYLPGARGFDYHYGNYGPQLNYFNYGFGTNNLTGRDFYENGYQVPQNCTNNHYYPDLILEKFEQVIHNADPRKPFYIHFATTLTHATGEWNGTTTLVNILETMPGYSSRPAVTALNDTFINRRRQTSSIQALDEQVRRIRLALTYKGVINNTIIVFQSDNGPVTRIFGTIAQGGTNYGSSWPLRMFKQTMFEGGVRAPAFIWSPRFRRAGRYTNQLFHVTDWLPTLYQAAGGNVSTLVGLDGVSQLKSLVTGRKIIHRTDIPINIDNSRTKFVNKTEKNPQYGVIWLHNITGILYKLVGGSVFNDSYAGWERTEGTTAANPMTTPTAVSVQCNGVEGVEKAGSTPCRPWSAACLFDLTNDPCELNNLALNKTGILSILQSLLAAYNSTSVPSVANSTVDPASVVNGWWVPWQDPEPVWVSPPCAPFNPSSAS
ncbi:Arylsulfatase J [Hypsibius exemplaris]|uniref:Arylsulfatase J n=1 Tax=Hypsibius exemplaris TaxID=2072580 RepID=A0A1W0WWI7_HYPEX|nr:Arylsulfatase J [Hypsibius exemplaris]